MEFTVKDGIETCGSLSKVTDRLAKEVAIKIQKTEVELTTLRKRRDIPTHKLITVLSNTKQKLETFHKIKQDLETISKITEEECTRLSEILTTAKEAGNEDMYLAEIDTMILKQIGTNLRPIGNLLRTGRP